VGSLSSHARGRQRQPMPTGLILTTNSGIHTGISPTRRPPQQPLGLLPRTYSYRRRPWLAGSGSSQFVIQASRPPGLLVQRLRVVLDRFRYGHDHPAVVFCLALRACAAEVGRPDLLVERLKVTARPLGRDRALVGFCSTLVAFAPGAGHLARPSRVPGGLLRTEELVQQAGMVRLGRSHLVLQAAGADVEAARGAPVVPWWRSRTQPATR
jgi:hypothetical protein